MFLKLGRISGTTQRSFWKLFFITESLTRMSRQLGLQRLKQLDRASAISYWGKGVTVQVTQERGCVLQVPAPPFALFLIVIGAQMYSAPRIFICYSWDL